MSFGMITHIELYVTQYDNYSKSTKSYALKRKMLDVHDNKYKASNASKV